MCFPVLKLTLHCFPIMQNLHNPIVQLLTPVNKPLLCNSFIPFSLRWPKRICHSLVASAADSTVSTQFCPSHFNLGFYSTFFYYFCEYSFFCFFYYYYYYYYYYYCCCCCCCCFLLLHKKHRKWTLVQQKN